MTQRGFSNLAVALSLALMTELTTGLSFTTPAQAQFKPPNLGMPRTTVGGASRSGTCMTDKTALTALVPTNIRPTDTAKALPSLTTEARPTFFLYLPKTTAQVAEFTIKSVNEKDVFRTTIPLAGRSGLVSFQLPSTAPTLEVGQDYQWFFSVICKPSDRLGGDVFVSAWITRIQPDQALSNALKAASPRQRPNVFAQAGIWHDTLTALTELRRTRPTDATLGDEWRSLLQSVGLSQITQVTGGSPVGQLTLGTTPRKP